MEVPKTNFVYKQSRTQMKMREFFPENFAERVVILHNYPKGP